MGRYKEYFYLHIAVALLPVETSLCFVWRILAFETMITRGLKDSKEGKSISNEEMKRRISTWQK